VLTLLKCVSHSSPTLKEIVAAAAAAACFCAVVFQTFWVGGWQAQLAHTTADTVGPVGDRLDFCATDTRKLSPLAARVIYQQVGVCVARTASDGSTTLFQPTPEDRAKRTAAVDRATEMTALVDKLATQAELSRACGAVYLGALSVVLAVTLLLARRRRREIPS
jgi:hypothetical protein